MCVPVLLSLQQFPVCVDLHIQGELDVQQLLVLAELSVHPLPQLAHILLLPFDGAPMLVSL